MGQMTTTDLWHHYGRTRASTDRDVPGAFRWSWGQDAGPGPEVLGELRGARVGDLGAGAARHAAYLATRHQLAQVVAVDSSPAQHAMAIDLYWHLAPRLSIVHADVVSHLHAMPATYDVLYSVFGAVDFTDPGQLLPAAAAALRPGGRLVFSTLAHYLTGAAAQSEVVPAVVHAKTPDGDQATMCRWVLQERVWTNLLDAAGFTAVAVSMLPATGEGSRTADTLLVSARLST
jgi:SAM-dependent methyltransferase